VEEIFWGALVNSLQKDKRWVNEEGHAGGMSRVSYRFRDLHRFFSLTGATQRNLARGSGCPGSRGLCELSEKDL